MREGVEASKVCRCWSRGSSHGGVDLEILDL
jgi:hypothetical protein